MGDVPQRGNRSVDELSANRTTAHQLRLISTTFDHIVFATEQMDVWGRWANGRNNKSAARRQNKLKAAFEGNGNATYLSAFFLAAASAFFVSASTCLVLNVGLSL
jgi:hypothetical protein